jgi:hypothetical protein
MLKFLKALCDMFLDIFLPHVKYGQSGQSGKSGQGRPNCPHCGGVRCFGACQFDKPDVGKKNTPTAQPDKP